MINMNAHPQVACPVCHGPMVPVKLHCDHCHISVAGRFAPNEFAGLAADDLHFLRIFVMCEGRIRDMESALGVSYPTIKARMAQLKETLGVTSRQSQAHTTPPLEKEGAADAVAILADLEAGRLTYGQAMEQLKKTKEKS